MWQSIRFNFAMPNDIVRLDTANAMNFQDLHEQLRLELLRRIERGTLTGTRLAQQTGFQQAHISNFLNGKRSLSLDGLDRVLAAQNLSIDQILPMDLEASAAPVNHEPTEIVPVVTASAALDEARLSPGAIIETIHISATRLADNRARPSPKSLHLQRFVAVRADAQQAACMEPVLAPGTIAVIDRHYNSLAPYRAQQPTLYAVRYGNALLFRFVDFDQNCLILRPQAASCAAQLLLLAPNETPADYLVGRVCLLFFEL
jgi:transcriptional regulator with XRE-family HTH domain